MPKLKIKSYPHTDPELWPLIGPLLTSREVVKELAGPLYSDPKTTWWVAMIQGNVVGFCSLREGRDGYWVENSYVLPVARDDGVHAALAEARQKHVESIPPRPMLVCCKQERWKHYKSRGFTIKQERGSWIYGIRGVAK